MEATDSRNLAGDRSSTSTLKMVSNEDSPPSADIEATIEGPQDEDSVLPHWYETGSGLSAEDGETTAEWEGEATSTVTAYGSDGDTNDSVTIEIVSPGKHKETCLDVEPGGKIGKLIDKVNEFLHLLKSGPNDPDAKLEAGGKVEITGEKVDYYNDGERIGDKTGIGGVIEAELGKLKFKSPDVPIAGLFSVFGEIDVDTLKFELSAHGLYDESKGSPWGPEADASASLSTGVKIGGGAAVGVPNGVHILEVKAMGGTNIEAKYTATLEDKDLYGKPEVSISPLEVTVTATFTLITTWNFELGKWQVAPEIKSNWQKEKICHFGSD